MGRKAGLCETGLSSRPEFSGGPPPADGELMGLGAPHAPPLKLIAMAFLWTVPFP